jgi:hypothetical protein
MRDTGAFEIAVSSLLRARSGLAGWGSRPASGCGSGTCLPSTSGLPGLIDACSLVLLDHVPGVVHPEVGHPGMDSVAETIISSLSR